RARDHPRRSPSRTPGFPTAGPGTRRRAWTGGPRRPARRTASLPSRSWRSQANRSASGRRIRGERDLPAVRAQATAWDEVVQPYPELEAVPVPPCRKGAELCTHVAWWSRIFSWVGSFVALTSGYAGVDHRASLRLRRALVSGHQALLRGAAP